MTRYVLIFAKTAWQRTPYDQWLAGSGVEPVILTPTEYADGYRHLPHVHAFDNYDSNQLVDKIALMLARKHQIDAVFARAEADIVRAAALRELLGLPGQHSRSAAAFRDKVVMKDNLRAGDVAVPSYRRVTSAYDLLDFVEEHGYPVVVKPVSESGSLGAAVIDTEEGLDRYLSRPWPGSSEIETFVPGQMYHVDGLVLHGEVAFIHPFRYLNDCLSFRRDDWLAHLPLPVDDPNFERLVQATRSVLGQLPTPRNTAFHAELWITPDDQIVFCEIASRTGGGMVSPTVRHCFGIDLDREWLLAECGLPGTMPAQPGYQAGAGLLIPPARGLLEHLPVGDEPDWVRDVVISGREGTVYHGGVKSGLFLAGYVVSGSSEDEVVSNLAATVGWFGDRVRYQGIQPVGAS